MMDRGGVFDASDLQAGVFTLAGDPDVIAARQAERVQSRAIRLSHRVRTARAKAETELATLLPPRIARGDTWHILSGGNIDALSYLQHILAAGPFDEAILSSWCMSIEDVKQLAAWLQSGQLHRLDVYVGEIFPSQYAAAFELLCQTVRDHAHGGRVAVFRNHSKVTVAASHARREYLVIESSANLNTNPRTEQTAITHSRKLAQFYADFFGSVKSFQRNFDNWQPPHAWPRTKAQRAQAH
jgi:hypothetical protein